MSVRSGAGGNPRKVAGTAQYRYKRNVLVHGVLLVDADIGELSRHLVFPSSQPDYRQDRTHRDFCISLAELPAGGAFSEAGLMAALCAAIAGAAAATGWDALIPPEKLDGDALRLETVKYRNSDWNWKRIRAGAN